MFRLLFVLSAVLAFGSGLKLPVVPLLDGRIVGGTEVQIIDVPYQISLQVKGLLGSYSHSCGGSIYNERVIVTAAHCLAGRSASALAVLVGVSSLKAGATPISVEKIVVHENYDSSSINNDVGLIFLSQKLEFASNIQPIALAEKNPEEGDDALVTGWGTTKESGSLSNNLLKVVVPIVGNEQCNKQYGAGKITDAMICAGVEKGGLDACQGDSGGPMVVNKELVGIVSWGRGCARPDYSGVYSSVANLREWIVKNAQL